jgi:hypothetical protein
MQGENQEKIKIDNNFVTFDSFQGIKLSGFFVKVYGKTKNESTKHPKKKERKGFRV